MSSKVSPSNGPAAVEGSCLVKIFVIGVSLVLVLLAIPDVELSAELVKTCLTKGFFLPPAAAPSEFSLAFPLAEGLLSGSWGLFFLGLCLKLKQQIGQLPSFTQES